MWEMLYFMPEFHGRFSRRKANFVRELVSRKFLFFAVCRNFFTDFKEIENEVAEKAPPIIYKYRDWSNEYHRSILTDCALWISHPKELNDPYDIRVPVRFDFSEIDNPLFFERLKYHAQLRFPHLHPNSRDFKVICENKFDLIKQNPEKYFEENYMQIRESDLYDRVGVFSLSSDALNEPMWAHYGNNGTGFCVGFDTLALARTLQFGFGYVEYEDEPPVYSFVRNIDENQKDQMFLKHIKWTYEVEFRFLTLRIASTKDRSVEVSPNSIKEVILGQKISAEHEKEIVELLLQKYVGMVRLYKTSAKAGSYGLQKQEINYQ